MQAKTKRLLKILIPLAVLIAVGVAFLVWWYLRQNSGPRLLAKADLAIRSDNPARAIDPLDRYIAGSPQDWRGYYFKGIALTRLGRFEEARVPLTRAADLDRGSVAVALASAQTYSLPALAMLSKEAASDAPETIEKAIDQLRIAVGTLSAPRPKDPKLDMDLREAMGMDWSLIADAWRARGRQLREKARIAETLGKPSDDFRKDGEKAVARALEASDEAAKALLGVVQQNPDRERALQSLIELCILRNDDTSLAAARMALQAAKSPPPVPVTLLALHDLTRQMDDATRQQESRRIVALLEGLLKEHPEQLEVKAALASVCEAMGNSERALELCAEILKVNPRLPRPRLIQSKLLMDQGQAMAAERNLFVLKTEYPSWPEAHLLYARAAITTGKKELARDAMRTVVKLVPTHAEARRYLAQSLCDDGLYAEAFADADALYKAHPDDSSALTLFVRTACRAEHGEQARKAVEKASQSAPRSLAMQLAIANSYAMLNEVEKARQGLESIATQPVANLQDLLAKAESLLEKHPSEAEKLLVDELVRTPNHPTVCYLLGKIYTNTRRKMQAADLFRAALATDKQSLACRLALADVLMDLNDLTQCEAVLGQIDASNVEANFLRVRLALAQGKQVPDLLVDTRQSGRSLALVCLRSGQPQKCIDVCLAELGKKPGDRDTLFILGQAYLAAGEAHLAASKADLAAGKADLADLAAGEKSKCLEQWKKLLAAAPERTQTYFSLADVWALDLPPAEVEKNLKALPDAKAEMVEFAMGRLYDRRGEFDLSGATYGRMVERAGLAEEVRNQARLLQARSLAAAGQGAGAIAILDGLAKSTIPALREQALAAKVGLLISTGQKPEAVAALQQLAGIAIARKDPDLAGMIANQYVRLQEPDKALSLCDQVQGLYPDDPRPYQMRASAIIAIGKPEQAVPLLEKAIALRPGDMGGYTMLSELHAGLQQPRAALDVLRKMEALGSAARIRSLMEQGRLLAQWGLYAQAVDRLNQVAQGGQAQMPFLQLQLGQAYGSLGQVEQARVCLKTISPAAPEYVVAQQALADLETTDPGRLAVLEELSKAYGGHSAVVAQKIAVLLRLNKAQEAVKEVVAFVDQLGPNRPVPPDMARRGLEAFLAAKDLKSASEFASRIAREGRLSAWRQIAVVLGMDSDAKAAMALIGPPEKAGPLDAALAVVLLAQSGDSAGAAKWLDRLDQAGADLAKQSPRLRSRVQQYQVLANLGVNRVPQAKAVLAEFKPDLNLADTPYAAAEIVARAQGGASVAKEAAKILRASVALDLGLQEQAGAWAMEALVAETKSQWAAAVIQQTHPDGPTRQKMIEMLQPKDCVVARLLQASLQMYEKKYAPAAEAYALAAAADKGNIGLSLYQAMAVEQAGRLEEALGLYKVVLDATGDPYAANNAAYLTTQLAPKDAKQLEEAGKWLEAAVKALPGNPSFRDTLGWVNFLLGKNDRARQEVGTALPLMADSAEVHYHAGAIAAKDGDDDLARWHLQAAVSAAESHKAKGQPLNVSEEKAAQLAQQSLVELEKKKPTSATSQAAASASAPGK